MNSKPIALSVANNQRATTVVIVESPDDEFFLKAVLKHMQLSEEFVVQPEFEYESVPLDNNPKKPTGLADKLMSLADEVAKKFNLRRIAILRDLDSSTKEQRYEAVINAISLATGETPPNNEMMTEWLVNIGNSSRPEQVVEICFSWHFIGVDGKGELEDLRRAIAKVPAPIADCVDLHLPECFEKNKSPQAGSLRPKDMAKLWLNNYIRYDTLLAKGLKADASNTSLKGVLDRSGDLYDFDSELPEMVALKDFLRRLAPKQEA